VIKRRRQVVKPTSPILAKDLVLLATNLLHQSRWTESESLLREGLATYEKSAPDDWWRSYTMSLLGESLLGQSRYAEAEMLIVTGYEGIKARQAKIPLPDRSRRLNDAAVRVVRLYEEWSKLDEAASWKAKLGMQDLPTTVFTPPCEVRAKRDGDWSLRGRLPQSPEVSRSYSARDRSTILVERLECNGRDGGRVGRFTSRAIPFWRHYSKSVSRGRS
jgi:hypothetical protein